MVEQEEYTADHLEYTDHLPMPVAVAVGVEEEDEEHRWLMECM